jgi:hypothetical protein
VDTLNPIAIHIFGYFGIRYYRLAYLLAFAGDKGDILVFVKNQNVPFIPSLYEPRP